MYEIIMNTWYQEKPDEIQREVYHGMGFETIEDACEFLGENCHKIFNEFPVQSVEIKFNILHKNHE